MSLFSILKGAIPAVLEMVQVAHQVAPDAPNVKKLDAVIAGIQTFVAVSESQLPALKTEISAVVNMARVFGLLPAASPAPVASA